MAASAVAATKASILMTGATFWIVEDVGGTTVMNQWKESELVCLPVRSSESGRSDSWQIAGAPGFDQRQPARVRSSGRRASEWRHAVEQPTAAPHGGRIMAGQWITVHDTEVDGTAPFDANALAKARRRHTIQAAGKCAVPAWFTLSDLFLHHHRRYG